MESSNNEQGPYWDSGKGNYKFTYNPTSNTLTITIDNGETDPDPDEPTPLTGKFVIKANKISNWSNSGAEMTEKDNVWTLKDYTFNEGDIQFVIRDNAGNGNKEYKSNATGTTITNFGTPYAVALQENDENGNYNFKISAAGTYTFVFDASDKDNLTLTVTAKNDDNDEEAEWSKKKFVYFNAGLDYDRDSKIGGRALYANFIKKGSTEPSGSTYRVLMTDNRTVDGANALLPLFFAPVPANYTDFDGVQFEVEGSSLVYNSKKCDAPNKYDADHAFDYIYSAETAVDKDGDQNICRAEQSYVTFEDYRARRDGDKIAVFYCGSNINGRDASDPNNIGEWFETNFDGKVGASQRSEDVFMFQVNPIDKNDEVKFKMSWIDANGRAERYNALNQTSEQVTGGDQRWWATFNLGLVGPTLAPKYGDDMAAAYKEEDCTVANTVGDNGAIAYTVNRCRKYSRYNSFDWWIKKGTLNQNNEDGALTFYVIVDTYYKTTALVAFEPRPTMESLKLAKENTYNATPDEAARFGQMLAGAEKHGSAKVDEVNVLSGVAKVNVSDNIDRMWGERYTIDYGIYYVKTASTFDTETSEDHLLTTFPGVKEATGYNVSIDNLPYGETLKVGVRCTYTDTDNCKFTTADGEPYVAKFRSFTNWPETMDYKPTFPDANINPVKTTIFLANGWHASVKADLNFVSNDADVKSYYLDVDPEKNNHGIHFSEANDFQVMAKIGDKHYTKADIDDSYTHEENNWAHADKNAINFVIEDIESPAENSAPSFELVFTLQCPFLIGDLEPVVTYIDSNNQEHDLNTNAARRASALAENSGKNILAAY